MSVYTVEDPHDLFELWALASPCSVTLRKVTLQEPCWIAEVRVHEALEHRRLTQMSGTMVPQEYMGYIYTQHYSGVDSQ